MSRLKSAMWISGVSVYCVFLKIKPCVVFCCLMNLRDNLAGAITISNNGKMADTQMTYFQIVKIIMADLFPSN
jgi:hypothetical protein